MRLAVELYGEIVGTLEGRARDFDLLPSAAGIERFGLGSTVLSTAIPLVTTPRRDRASRRRTWFAELLPEGDQYQYMLAQGGLRVGDTPGFLARYGRDVAGALQVWDLDDPGEPSVPGISLVTDGEIAGLLRDPIRSPLANAPELGKSSLGGVQPKVVLARTPKGWAQALGGYPTTHILKPQLGGERSCIIFDEEFGSRIARRLGLADFRTAVEHFDGLAALVIERYDRLDGVRLHQEDLSQALGARGNEKYQELGGVVSLRRVADVIARHAPEVDLRRLGRMVTLAVAIGDLDRHTKNIALLHPADGLAVLAPMYDVVPQAHHRGDGRLAMAVNGVYRHVDVTIVDLAEEIAGWGVRRSLGLVTSTLEEVATALESVRALSPAAARRYLGLRLEPARRKAGRRSPVLAPSLRRGRTGASRQTCPPFNRLGGWRHARPTSSRSLVLPSPHQSARRS